MLDWLVIIADDVKAGRGVRGYTLLWFLQTYFGRRRVQSATPDELRRSPIAADTVFVGLPNSLTPEEIRTLLGGRYRRVVLYDYLDEQRLAWTPEQEPALRELSQHYLKPWLERAWDFGLQMGMLPIRRPGRLTTVVMVDRALRKLGWSPTKEYDVAFFGQPNVTSVLVDGQVHAIDQRFDWLAQIRREAPDLRLWGGLVVGNAQTVARLEAEHGDISHLYYGKSKVSFVEYFRAMQRSRVLLAPGGNAPWTYRHYECLYAGGVVVTVDYRQRDMLVPLPTERMVHVPDGAGVVPYVREAIELSRARPTLGEENIAHLERYLRFARYSRTRKPLIERFVNQFD